MYTPWAPGLLILVVVAQGGCGGSIDDFDDCTLGDLHGTWRGTYMEQSGTCGEQQEQTFPFDSTSGITAFNSSNGADRCADNGHHVANNQCSANFAFLCPTKDGKGSVQWTGDMVQTGEGAYEAITTANREHPTLGHCRSTYRLTMHRL